MTFQMRKREILKRLAEIRTLAETDDERAHGAEDQLFLDVLEMVARPDHGMSVDELAVLARTALRSSKLDFGRNCA